MAKHGQDRKARVERVDLLATGAPVVDGGAAYGAPGRFIVEIPAVSDDGRREGRIVAAELMVDDEWLRRLVRSAEAAGWVA